MIPRFITIGMNAFKTEEVDYIILKDSDLPSEYVGRQYFIVLKNGIQHLVEFEKIYEVKNMQKFLSEFNLVCIEDKISGDIYSINSNNIIYIERDIKNLLRIHFKDNILCLPVEEDKEVYKLIKLIVE